MEGREWWWWWWRWRGEPLSLGVVGVGLHVAMEVARLREPEIAHLAAVRLLSAVYPLVLGERGRVGKGLPAVVAPVGPLPGVRPKVGGHGGTLREPLLADGAAEWLLPAVRTEVCSEVRSLGERLPADLAVVRLLPAVSAHVGLEGGGSGVALPAHLAHVAARLAGRPLGFGGGGVVVVHLDAATRRGPVADGHGEREDVDGDRLNVVLVLREAHARPRHRVATDGLPRGVAGGHALPHGLHKLGAGLGRRGCPRHGVGEDGGRCGGAGARAARG